MGINESLLSYEQQAEEIERLTTEVFDLKHEVLRSHDEVARLKSLIEGAKDQSRTMCKTHGWWDIGPCPYCTGATGDHKEDCHILDYVPRPCNCGAELDSGRDSS